MEYCKKILWGRKTVYKNSESEQDGIESGCKEAGIQQLPRWKADFPWDSN